MTKQTIEGFLPIFKGFYGSIEEDIFDQKIENDFINDDEDNLIYKKYCNDVAKKYISLINEAMILHNSIITFEFEQVNSPREYNFQNDEIQTKTTFDYDAIIQYVKYHMNQLDEFCKSNFTSFDGFCSFYPNNAVDFLKLLDTDKKESVLNHLINFIVCNIVDEDKIQDEINDFCYNWEG